MTTQTHEITTAPTSTMERLSLVYVNPIVGITTMWTYYEGMTVADALALAEITVAPGQGVSHNGRIATRLSDPVHPDSVIDVVSRISNG